MIIMCDIDNCINDLTSQVVSFYNSRAGKNIKLSDITTYNFYECLSKEDADGIMELFKEKDVWDSLKPLHGSQDALRKLIKYGHRVYFATSTDPINFEWKCIWIKRYFDFIPTDNIIRIMDKSLLKCDVLIDDCLDNLIGNICERIVLDYSWNQTKTKDFSYDIHRAKNWNEIVNIINNVERKNQEWEKM